MNTTPIRLDPAAVIPGGIEQLTAKLVGKTRVLGVKLDEPDAFQLMKVIAGPYRIEVTDDMKSGDTYTFPVPVDISPPNAFVILLVKNLGKEGEGETKVCAGELVCDEAAVAVASPAAASATTVSRPTPVHKPASAATQGASGGTVTMKTDARGWPLGGMNEVWVLMNRGEAERLVLAINGYPISGAEKPALLRRFNQALGKV